MANWRILTRMPRKTDILLTDPDFKPLKNAATVANPVGQWACKLFPDSYFPNVIVDKRGKERVDMPDTRLRFARIACVQCVNFDDCFDNRLPSSKYGIVAGVNSSPPINRQRPHRRAVQQLRQDYLVSIGRAEAEPVDESQEIAPEDEPDENVEVLEEEIV